MIQDDDGFAHTACGNDNYELCREMVFLTREWGYDQGTYDTSWQLEDYETCIDTALVTELIYCQDWEEDDLELCKRNAETRARDLRGWGPFKCLKDNTCGCPSV